MVTYDPVAAMLDIIAKWNAPWEAPFAERAMACAIAYENGEPHENFYMLICEHYLAWEKRHGTRAPRYFSREGVRQ